MKMSRALCATVFLLGWAQAFLAPRPASAVPMWARRYNVSCTFCHAWPSQQLTASGLDFFRRGHRLPADTFDKDVTHLISAHAEWSYEAQKGESNAFTSPEFHLHAGGALSSLFSGYVDANVNNDFESSYLQLTKSLGVDETYFTVRGGKFSPTLIRNYGQGLGASASTPLVLTDVALGSNPFTPGRASFGIDAAVRLHQIFIQAGVVNGEDVPGQATVGRHKDVYATAELALPDGISGIGLYAYRGGYDLGDPSDPTAGLLFDRYDRTGVFANFTRDAFRLAGAYLYGKDQVTTLSNQKLHGYFAQLDYHASEHCVPFARYDDVRTDVEEERGRVQKATLGLAYQLFANEVTAGRAVLELSRRREAGTDSNAASIDLLWAF